jgi:hypothetical protein
VDKEVIMFRCCVTGAIFALGACANHALVEDEDSPVVERVDNPSCPPAPAKETPERVAKETAMLETLLAAVARDDPERFHVEVALAERHLQASNYSPGCALLDVVLDRTEPRDAEANAMHESYCMDDRRDRCGDLGAAAEILGEAEASRLEQEVCPHRTHETQLASCRDGIATCCELAGIYAEYQCLERRAVGDEEGATRWCAALVSLNEQACSAGRESACHQARRWRQQQGAD